MNTLFFLALWFISSTSIASLVSRSRQTDFIGFLQEGNDGGVKEYLDLYPDEIDPSYHDGEAIIQACLTGNLEILRLLLKHPLVDPNVRGGSPLMLCVNLNRIDCLTELLKDGRASVKPLNLLFVPRDLSIMWFLGSLTNPILEACWNGNAEELKKMNLSWLGYKQLDILFARARNHPDVLKELKLWVLRVIGLPVNEERDIALCTFMDRLPMMPTKRLCKFIKHRATLELVCKNPHVTAPALIPEIADLISLQLDPDVKVKAEMKIYPSLYFSAALFLGILAKKAAYSVGLPADAHYCVMLAINLALGRYYFWKYLQWIKWKRKFVDIFVIDLISLLLFASLSTYIFLTS